MIDHVGIRVRDVKQSKAFYEAALAPLGYRVVKEFTAEQTSTGHAVGFGESERADFWLGDAPELGRSHVAFATTDRGKVDAFYAAAIAAGGKNNGAPGPRPHYHPDYYGAFVLDPDGNNVEAVCRKPR